MLLSINILIVMTMLTSCYNYQEIDKLLFVRAVAVDKPAAGNGIKLTISSEVASPSKGKGESEKKSLILSAEGKTVFEANRAFYAFSPKDIFWGHSKYIMIGETAAKEDILKYLDFFIRNHENRLNASVSVVYGSLASDLMTHFEDTSFHKKLSGIYDNTGALSTSKEIQLAEFIGKLNNKYASAYLPCFHIIENPKMKIDKEYAKKDIELNGYAIFKGKKLLECIEGKTARGLNWVNGDIESYIIVVKDPKGNDISLEIIDKRVKIKTNIKNGKPSITVKVGATSNIGEIEGQVDVFNKKSFSQLEEQQKTIIKDDIESVIAFAQENNVDILGFADKLFHQHPVKWESIKDKWNELFPKINVAVEVETKIIRSYNINQPIRSWEEKKK